jgi:hypothetical protein
VALARVEEALMIMPGTLIILPTLTDWDRKLVRSRSGLKLAEPFSDESNGALAQTYAKLAKRLRLLPGGQCHLDVLDRLILVFIGLARVQNLLGHLARCHLKLGGAGE